MPHIYIIDYISVLDPNNYNYTGHSSISSFFWFPTFPGLKLGYTIWKVLYYSCNRKVHALHIYITDSISISDPNNCNYIRYSGISSFYWFQTFPVYLDSMIRIVVHMPHVASSNRFYFHIGPK